MRSLSGQRVLVTGATGFIGANLVRALLQSNAEIHVIARAGADRWRLAEIAAQLIWHAADLTARAPLARAVAAAQPDFIFHSAAFGGHSTTAAQRAAALGDTVAGTANLLEALAPLPYRRLVHLGSSLEYGPKAQPLREDDLLTPNTFRGATKAAAALLCLQAARAEQKPIVVLRPFSVYGPWEAHGRLLPTLMLALLRGGELPLTEAGIYRDFIFVEDVVEACLRAAATDGVVGEIINAGSGEQYSNEEVVALAQEVAGIRLKVTPGTFPRRPSDTAHWVADIGKAQRLLDWQPRHDLRVGLTKTFAWFRAHQQLYREH
ncbi:MAG: NAD-dependent epimerase/dehydratase family protein [Acidobacteria bacterium]|nr:NAD-dependent epimerase/dehydratase family protein [Acidobacteriota bacterium]